MRKYYDIFNGDADGLCALHQLRLEQPRSAELITGVKRDIQLLSRVDAAAGDEITVLDISLKSNAAALAKLLRGGVKCRYFDHHMAGVIPAHPGLSAHIDTAPDMCTSLIVDRHLSASGYAVVQTTSPLIARKSFWTIVTTIEAAGLATTPYHAHVPSFGEWGFIVASRRPFRLPPTLPATLRFLTVAGLPALFDFPPDMARVPTEINRLSNQVLVQTFEEEWGKVAR